MKFQSAPHFSSEANTGAGSQSGKAEKFQSAPHFSSEANASTGKSALTSWSFNPRLTSAARRTEQPGGRAPHKVVSIRASLQQRGEQILLSSLALRRFVSIRASLQQRGEPNQPTTEGMMLKFQSAPHFSSEANRGHANTSTGQQGFNPRLTSAARRTQRIEERSSWRLVSIRASLQQRGELIPCPFYLIVKEVSIRASLQQRGELIAATVKGESSSFNPRLTSAARRTPVFGWVLLGAAMFQSAPHFSSEANVAIRVKNIPLIGFNPRLTSAARRTASNPGEQS